MEREPQDRESRIDFRKLCQILKAKEVGTRKQGWLALPGRHRAHAFSQTELKKLREMLQNEEDLDCRTSGIIPFVEVLHSAGGVPPAETLADWLFEPFWRQRRDAAGASHKALVFSAYEKGIRDAQAQIAIAHLLPSSSWRDTSFRHVLLEQPEWDDTGISQAPAVCFVGRPLMFSQCSMVEQFPKDLRYSILPPESGDAADFFCVTENRAKAGALQFPTAQDGSRRTDYAIVQRFPMVFGGHSVTVIVVAGASSLGTAGAARWVAKYDWTEKNTVEFARVAGLKTIDRSTRFEALLEVSAAVHEPAQPWEPKFHVKALFLNRSRNLLKIPSRITLGTESGLLTHARDVRYLLFDEHEMDFGETDTAVVIALLVKCCLENTREVRISDLMTDTRLWPGTVPTPRSNKVFLSDHLQRRSLNGLVEVAAHSIRLGGCEVEVVRVESAAPPRMPAVGVQRTAPPTSSRAAAGARRLDRNK